MPVGCFSIPEGRTAAAVVGYAELRFISFYKYSIALMSGVFVHGSR